MSRIFEIVPVTTTEIEVRGASGSVERDFGMMYDIGEDAERAFDLILEPYGQHGGWYLDKIQLGRGRRRWAFVALRREYDIGAYVIAQRSKIDAGNSFGFTIYDQRSIGATPPKVACFVFSSKNSLAAAAEKIRFLRPAWTLLQDKTVEKTWLVLLDEEPVDVMSEAALKFGNSPTSANSHVSHRSREGLEQEVLDAAAIALFEQLGRIDDLGQELSNTVANIYYRFHLLNKNLENPLAALGGGGDEIISQYSHFMTNAANVMSDYKHVREFVQSMRETRRESGQLFDYLVTLTLDIFKYRIPNAETKMPLRRYFARRFRKVREIDGLYAQMLRVGSAPTR